MGNDDRVSERTRPASPEPPAPLRDLDWAPERARALADPMVNLWEELLRQLPSMPPDPGGRTRTAIADALLRELPEEGLPNEALVEHARQLVFDHSIYPGSPGFMAYVVGPGTVPGALADLLAAGLNQNVGGWQLAPGATEIELHLTQWFASRFGLPEGSGGLILSGGSMANFTGLKLARDARGGLVVRKDMSCRA